MHCSAIQDPRRVYDGLLLLGWTLGGGLEWLNNTWSLAGLGTLSTGIGVILSAFIIMALLEMPFSLYHTFVVEERFGFNRSTPSVFIMDLIKQTALLIVLGGAIIPGRGLHHHQYADRDD